MIISADLFRDEFNILDEVFNGTNRPAKNKSIRRNNLF